MNHAQTADYVAALQLFGRYSNLIDAGRYEAWATLFTEEGSLWLRGVETTGRDAIRRRLQLEQVEGVRRAGIHVITGLVVSADGNAAEADATAVYLTSLPPESARIHMAATYHSRLTRPGADADWLFQRHEIYSLHDRPDDVLVLA